MVEYKHRKVSVEEFMGQEVRFITTNDRLAERVQNLSHERDVLQSLIAVSNPDDVVWDIGACMGIHSFTLAKHLPGGEVVGFEPMPTNRGVLMDNRSINELANVYISKTALSDTDGMAEFAIRQSFQAGYGRHSLMTGEDRYDKIHTVDVETRRGTSLVASGELPAPNLVKIDTEGSGPLVLQGMRDLLVRDSCRAVIMETHEPNDVQPSHEDFGWTREDIIEFFEECGFEVGTLDEEFHLLATKDAPKERGFEAAALDVEFVQGDIAEQEADALVNSAGTSLRMGTGVAGAIRERGGESIHDEAIRMGPVEPGQAVSTTAGSLDAEYIIHAASMPHYGRGRSTPNSVRQAVERALTIADDFGCESIVVPAVGCGLGGLSLATGADIIGDVLREFEPDYDLSDVRVIAYTDDEYQTICDVLGE